MKKQTIVDAVSRHFTNVWIKNQDKAKLEGFKDTAEQCRRDQNSWVWGWIIGVFFILMSTLLFFMSFMGQEEEYFWPGIIGVIVLFGNKFLRQGENQKALLRDWKPIRRKLLRYGVLQNAWQQVKKDKADYVGEDEVRKILVKAFDSSMKSLHARLRKAEQEGFPKREEHLLLQMEDLKGLISEMGIQMTFGNPV